MANFRSEEELRRANATADNPYWTSIMWGSEHLEAFWQGRTLSQVLSPGTLMAEQLPSLFPGLQGAAPPQFQRPVYTPEEVHIYNQLYEAYNLTSRPPANFYLQNQNRLVKTDVYFPIPMRFLQLLWQPLPSGQMIQGVVLPRMIKSEYFLHGVQMINFNMNMRSCICFNMWGIWMNLQEQLQQGNGGQLPDFLNDVFCYVALRLEVGCLERGLFDWTLRFWNRRYADFFLHSSVDFELTDLELSTTRVYFTGRMKASYVATLLFCQVPQNSLLHPATGHFRFMRALLQSRPHQLLGSDDDRLFPIELVLRTAPFRSRP